MRPPYDAMRCDAMRCDAMLVLGCGLTKDGKPGGALRSRLDEAAKAYAEGCAGVLILCGGDTVEGHNEARAMREYLLACGIPSAAMQLEPFSRSTRDNLRLSDGIRLELGAERLLVITSGFHARRVRYNARQLHLNVTVRAARFSFTADAFYLFFREFAAMAATLLYYPQRRGEYRPGWYYKYVEMKGHDGNPMKAQLFKGNQVKSMAMGEGITRKILARGGNVMMCQFHFQKGAKVAEHSHANEQITYVVSGSIIAHGPDGDAELFAGDSIYFPPNAPHAVTVTGENTVAVDVFTPMREDFLASEREG